MLVSHAHPGPHRPCPIYQVHSTTKQQAMLHPSHLQTTQSHPPAPSTAASYRSGCPEPNQPSFEHLQEWDTVAMPELNIKEQIITCLLVTVEEETSDFYSLTYSCDLHLMPQMGHVWRVLTIQLLQMAGQSPVAGPWLGPAAQEKSLKQNAATIWGENCVINLCPCSQPGRTFPGDHSNSPAVVPPGVVAAHC